jgi:hypothetical protein
LSAFAFHYFDLSACQLAGTDRKQSSSNGETKINSNGSMNTGMKVGDCTAQVNNMNNTMNEGEDWFTGSTVRAAAMVLVAVPTTIQFHAKVRV